MKKAVATILTGIILSTALLTGCGGAKNKDKIASNASNVNDAGVFPIAKEKITLKVAIKQSPYVKDYDNNAFTKWVEEKTNIDIQFEMLPNKDTGTKVNLIMASGSDMPDVILGSSVEMSTVYGYALDKLVLPLNDYIDKYGVEYKNMIKNANNKKLASAMTTPDGKIYALPKYVESEINKYSSDKVWIYKPWLDKLGLKVPTTTEEFYNVLKAFKEKDPNGNGKADEIPFAGAAIGGWYSSPVTPIMNPFIPDDGKDQHLFVQNEKIIANYLQPEFKEGLKYLNKLTMEKLLDPVSFTQDFQQLKQIANKETPILGSFVGGSPTVNLTNPRVYDYIPVPVLKGPTGKGGAVEESGLPATGGAFFITSSCKNPEAAYRLGDFLLGEEAALFARFGVPNVDWKKADAGDIGMDGKPAFIKVINPIWNTVQNSHWAGEHSTYNPAITQQGQAVEKDKKNMEAYQYKIVTENIKPYAVASQVPPLIYTKEEVKDFNTMAATIKEHVNTNIARFATGARDVDKEWDKFQKELKDLGIDKYLKLIQDAYDRQYKK